MKHLAYPFLELKNASEAVKSLDFDLELKTFDAETGAFEGYAAYFNNVDRGNDIILPGAFKRSLEEFKSKNAPIPLLWQHNDIEPIGFIPEYKEDDKGLLVKGQLDLEVQKAREAKSLMKNKVISAMSIGYRATKKSYNASTGIRTLIEVDLKEVSMVTFPMNDNARVHAIKKRIEDGLMPKTIADFERLLRDVGFSKKNATIVANEGIKGILRSDSGSTKKMAMLEALKSFKI